MISVKNVEFDNGLPLSADAARRQIAHRIRQLRLQAGWSQLELARRVAMPVVTYRLFERTGQIQLERLCRLAMVLGRMQDFVAFLEPPPLNTVQDLEKEATKPRKYGRTQRPSV